MIVFERLIKMIFKKKKEIAVNKKTSNIRVFIPKIYYIGMGKTGSATIMRGFKGVNVAHWHNTKYFESIFNTKLLSNNNLDLYDLIKYIGKRFNFKPIIIECVRNPIEKKLSHIFYFHIHRNCKHCNKLSPCEFCNTLLKCITSNNSIEDDLESLRTLTKKTLLEWPIDIPYSIKMWQKHFELDLITNFNKDMSYYYNSDNSCKLLLLKFENIKEWNRILNNLFPYYRFILNHKNNNLNKSYSIIKKTIRFSEEEIDSQLYNADWIKSFYKMSTLDEIKQKYVLQ